MTNRLFNNQQAPTNNFLTTVIPPFYNYSLTIDEMRKAEEDSLLLKSLVEPLEEQIVALKGKLRETDSLLQEYEKRQVGSC